MTSHGRLLKPAEVAEQLSVSRTWVYEAASDGRLPAVRLGGPGGPLRFLPEDLEAWIAGARGSWHLANSGPEARRRPARPA
ncbi:MAG: helix-turn-helix domain-containing protein [Solirubrobacterales bacterium]